MALKHMLLAAGAAHAASNTTSAPPNGTDISNSCGNDPNFSPPFNASGTVALDFHGRFGDALAKPWYLTVALKEGSAWNSKYARQQYITSYISVPNELIDGADANRTQFCLYMMDARAPAADKYAACDKVLSDKCRKDLDTWLASSRITDECPDFDIMSNCGWQLINTATPRNLTSNPCDRHGVPGVSSIAEMYTSRGFFGFGFSDGDAKDKFDSYDAHTKESTPLISIVGYQNKTSNQTVYSAAALCLVPNEIAEGSRNPSNPSLAVDLSASKATLALSIAASVFLANFI